MTALYFHIPYCVQKCRYCDFCSVPVNETADRYCDALIREIALQKDRYPHVRASTVFFGGGTPSVLPAPQLARVLEAAANAFSLCSDAEISIECNPKTVSRDTLFQLRSGGFNRLSIGLQSHDDTLLKRIGRAHTYADFLNTFSWAREAGFSNINVDLMHGLPGQTQTQYHKSLKAVTELEPEHVSAYALILEEGTPLFADVAAGRETLPGEDETADMQDMGIAYLEAHGFMRYEISNFAKIDHCCRHNLTYWNNRPYLGFGVAAHSSMPDERRWYRFSNVSDIGQYLRRIEHGRVPEAERILINTFEQMFESVMLGLRLVRGVDLAAFSARFGCDLRETFPEAIEKNRERGLWDEADPRFLRLNRRGLDLLNTVLLDFSERRYLDLLR